MDDPQQLLPKLPKPKDLQPFPTQLTLQFLGHSGKVRCSAVRQNRTVPRKKPLVQVKVQTHDREPTTAFAYPVLADNCCLAVLSAGLSG